MKPIVPHTPIQYVMGKTKFFELDFIVDDRALIPRPETEVLVYAVLDLLNEPRTTNHEPRILDLGTGSGCIAISLTKNIGNCKMFASDVSEEALEVAKENAGRNGVGDKITFIKSDLFKDIEGKFDIIVSNPPYVSRPEFKTLQKEVLMEPRVALDGGDDGLYFYRKIIPEAGRYIKDGGYLFFEIGFAQRSGIEDIFRKTPGFKIIKVLEDHNEIDRIVLARWMP